MKIYYLFLILGFAVVLTYCSPRLYTPSQKDIGKAQQISAEADSAYIVAGRDAYAKNCSNCHYLYEPYRYTANHWDLELVQMRSKTELSDADFNKIRVYLLTYCKVE